MRKVFLFALTIFTALSVSAQRRSPVYADMILVNGIIWTGNDNAAFAEAVAIKGNTILQTGTSAVIKKLANGQTKIIDLHGKLVTAGINDAHIHFLSGSLGLLEIDLNESKTIDEALKTIETFAREHPEKKWVTGMGWQYNLFPGSMPTKELLDKIISDRPVYIRAYDGHSAWVNSKALEMAGINRDTKFSGFGEIIKNAAGEPTGALTEGAKYLVSKFIPEPTTDEKLYALRKGMQYAAAHGMTSIQNANGSVEEFSLFETLLNNGELTLRSSTAFSVGKNTTDTDIKKYLQVKNRMSKNPMLQAGSVKFMLDGVIESHTAPMLEPYSDVAADSKMANSDFALPLDTYRNLVVKLDKAGFQIYTHAIGDRSVREALNAYENAQKINGTGNRRHRIEHIEQSSPDDVPRFAKLGVLASMEPIHADPGTIDVWAKAVGEKRLPHSFVWASMLKNNVKLVYSSDWPACINPDPVRGLHNAVNRRTIEGFPADGWVPEQKVSVKDALVAYTQGGAYSSFEENKKGKIMPGYLADIIVFSQNLFQIPSMDIYKTKVLMTVFNGKIIYEDKESLK
jgi:predicted amidohydrolase YtcJ